MKTPLEVTRINKQPLLDAAQKYIKAVARFMSHINDGEQIEPDSPAQRHKKASFASGKETKKRAQKPSAMHLAASFIAHKSSADKIHDQILV